MKLFKKNKKTVCVSCGKKMEDKDIDKTRTEYKVNPVCKYCSEEIYRAFNG